MSSLTCGSRRHVVTLGRRQQLALAKTSRPRAPNSSRSNCQQRTVQEAPAPAEGLPAVRSGSQLACFTAILLAGMQGPALAEELITYNRAVAEDSLQNFAGAAYVVLVGFFLFRVLRRRAARARGQKVSSGPVDGTPSLFDKLRANIAPVSPERQQAATPVDALLGAVQAGLIGYGLFLFASKMTAIMESQALPDAYTVRNISITVRTILQGLVWLATFIFCVNSVGLLGLSFQLLIFPDSLRQEEERRAKLAASRQPQLPRVSLTSNPEDVRRAFDAAERQGKEIAASSSNSDGVAQ